MKSDIHTAMVAERYARMSNEELIGQVTLNAAGMTPEAIEIANREIAARGLNPRLMESIAVQNRPLTEEEVEAYCELVSRQPCPHCGGNNSRLNAARNAEAMSFLLFTMYKRKLIAGCAPCLNKKTFISLGKSFLLGWWGVPWGPVRTIQAVYININSFLSHNKQAHNEYLREYVARNKGTLETMNDNDFDWGLLAD